MIRICNVILIFSLLVCCGCSSRRNRDAAEKYREVHAVMGTIVQVDVCYVGEDQPRLSGAYARVWERLSEIDQRMSVFRDDSDVAKINQSYGNPAEIQEDTYHLLGEAVAYSELTRGTFDITVWPLIALWKKAEKKNQVPSQAEILSVKKSLGVRNIRLSAGSQVEVLNRETKIDLGGIAKGYAVDEAAKILRANGFESFFIDAGGDIYVGGKNCEGKSWRIGIRDPRNLSGIMEVVEVSDAAVTTSGDYEQFYEIQGQRWSHIINPVTGYPQKGVISATMIAPTAVAADALSTALCVLGPQKGISMVDSLGKEFSALVVIPDEKGEIQKYKSRYFFR